MDFSIVPGSKVFKTYQGQTRIAELNKKSQVKRIQGQIDQVSISKDARQALWEALLALPIEDPISVSPKKPSEAENEKPEPTPTEDFTPGI
jgi:hypothetical protein